MTDKKLVMKIAVLTDIHGRSLDDFLNEISDVDKIYCLGDFDFVSTIHEVMDLRKDFDVEVVPGNHEHAIYKGVRITSGTMREQGVTASELHTDLMNDERAKEFVEDLLQHHKLEVEVSDFSTVVMHAALNGNLWSMPDAKGKVRELWYRLLSKEDHVKNFEVMKEQGFELMIRGHDAHNEFAVYKDGEVEIKRGSKHELKSGRLQTVTVGDYYEGYYAVVEDGVVSFREV